MTVEFVSIEKGRGALTSGATASDSVGNDARYLNKLHRLLGKPDEANRKLPLRETRKLAHP
jgi:hypothetical protein